MERLATRTRTRDSVLRTGVHRADKALVAVEPEQVATDPAQEVGVASWEKRGAASIAAIASITRIG
jgi:hypothetical protein